MATNAKKPFETLAIRYNTGDMTAVFFVDEALGQCIDPVGDTLAWGEFLVYGISGSDEEIDGISEGDFSSAIQIGSILGCHIPSALITDLGYDTYQICDDSHGDLEAMYSVLQEYKDDYWEYDDDIYYIHEIELYDDYQDMGYEKLILLQLPTIIVKMLHVFPTLLVYYPLPKVRKRQKRDLEAEAILMHRLEYNMQTILNTKRDDNIILFPPMCEVPDREINRVLGRRNPGNTVPEAHRNQALYDLYKSAGFKEIGKTGWLCKPIASIYTKDGMNR